MLVQPPPALSMVCTSLSSSTVSCASQNYIIVIDKTTHMYRQRGIPPKSCYSPKSCIVQSPSCLASTHQGKSTCTFRLPSCLRHNGELHICTLPIRVDFYLSCKVACMQSHKYQYYNGKDSPVNNLTGWCNTA